MKNKKGVIFALMLALGMTFAAGCAGGGWSDSTGDSSQGSTSGSTSESTSGSTSGSTSDSVTTHTVTIDVNGVTTTQSVEEGQTLPEPDEPTPPQGKYFVGWYVGETEYDFTSPVLAGFTLTAKFDFEYTVTIDVNGATTTQTIRNGQTVTEPETPTAPQGKYFVGWYVGETEYDFTTPVTEGFTITAKFDFEYTVTIDVNGTTTTQTIRNGDTVTQPETPTAPQGTRFVGWFVEDDEYGFSTPVTESFTITAKFINIYNVVFKNTDGTPIQENNNIDEGEVVSYTGSVTPTKEQDAQYTYTFSGWYDEEGDVEYAIDDNIPVETNLVLTPVFTPNIRSYQVTFVNGADTFASDMVEYGDTVSAPQNKPTTTDNTKKFGYWADSEGVEWDFATKTIVGETTLQAVFVEKETYQVLFLNEDGSSVATYDIYEGNSVTFDKENPTKEADKVYEYIFSGWTDGKNTYESVSNVTVNEPMTFTAVYTEKYVEYTLTIKYVADGQEITSLRKELKYKYGDEITREATATTEYTTYDEETSTTTYYSADKYWFGGLVTENATHTVTYTKLGSESVWDGTSVATSFESGTGSETDPYVIASAAQLAYLSEVSRGIDYGEGLYFKLSVDIDLGGHSWIPICHRNSWTNTSWKWFLGHFDGNNHTISGLNIGNEVSGTTRYCGLGLIAATKGTVKDLTLKGTVVGSDRAGALAYNVNGATIENVVSYVDVTTSYLSTSNYGYIGGLIGTATAVTFKNCVNYGTVKTNSDSIGGIVGESNGSTFINCKNYADISGTVDVGGIVGYEKGAATIENCINYGDVSSIDNANTSYIRFGGIAGYTVAATVSFKDNVNYGDVSGCKYVAGIVGYTKGAVGANVNHGNITGASEGIGGIVGWTNTTVAGTTNNGNVVGSGGFGVGGVVGWLSGSAAKVEYSNNYGKVTSTFVNESNITKVGGIVGYGSGHIDNCINYGDVEGKGGRTGGINGEQNGATLTNSKNYGKVTSGGATTGGIAGLGSTKAQITNCINEGSVYSTHENVGGIVGNASGAIVVDCTNYADIHGKANNVAGIAGQCGGATITSCINNGDITGEAVSTGGITGNNATSTVTTKCTNNGDVTGKTKVGGIAGYCGYGSYAHVAEGNVNTGKVVSTNEDEEYLGLIIGHYNHTYDGVSAEEEYIGPVNDGTIEGVLPSA